MGRWGGAYAQWFPGSLSAVLRGGLERAALRGRMGWAEPAAPSLDAGAGNVEEREPELLALPAAHPGRDRSAAAARLGRAAAPLPAEDGRGKGDRDHDPPRAASRLGPLTRTHAGRAPGRSLPHLRPKDLHHLR